MGDVPGGEVVLDASLVDDGMTVGLDTIINTLLNMGNLSERVGQQLTDAFAQPAGALDALVAQLGGQIPLSLERIQAAAQDTELITAHLFDAEFVANYAEAIDAVTAGIDKLNTTVGVSIDSFISEQAAVAGLKSAQDALNESVVSWKATGPLVEQATIDSVNNLISSINAEREAVQNTINVWRSWAQAAAIVQTQAEGVAQAYADLTGSVARMEAQFLVDEDTIAIVNKTLTDLGANAANMSTGFRTALEAIGAFGDGVLNLVGKLTGLGDAENAAAARSRGFGASMVESGGLLGAFHSNIVQFITAMTGFTIFMDAGRAIQNFAGYVIQGNITLEKFRQQLLSLTGSSGAADAIVAWSFKFGRTIPDTTANLQQAIVTVQSLGLNVQGTMPVLANLAAAMGTTLPIAAQSFLDAYEGRFFMLQRRLRVSKQELEQYGLELAKNGSIVQSTLLPALERYVAVKFPDATRQAMEAYYGQASNLTDQMQQLAMTFGYPVFEVFKQLMVQLITFIADHRTVIFDLAAAVGQQLAMALQWVINMLHWFGTEVLQNHLLMTIFQGLLQGGVIYVLQLLAGVIGGLVIAFLAAAGPALALGIGVRLLWTWLQAAYQQSSAFRGEVDALRGKLQDLGGVVLQVGRNFGTWGEQQLPKVQPAMTNIFAGIPGVVSKIGQVASAAGNFFGTILGFVSSFTVFSTAAGVVASSASGIGAALSGIGATLGGTFKQTLATISNTVQTQLKPAWDNFLITIHELTPLLRVLGNILGAVVVVAIAIVLAAINGLIAGLGQLWSGSVRILGGFVQLVSGVLLVLSSLAAIAWQVILVLKDLVTLNFGQLAKDWSGFGPLLANLGRGVAEAFKGLGGMILGVLQATLGVVFAYFGQFFAGLGRFIAGLAPNLGPSIASGFSQVGQSIFGAFTAGLKGAGDLGKAILTWLGQALTALGGAHTAFNNAVLGVFVGAFTKVHQVLSDALQAVLGVVHGFVGKIVGFFVWLYEHNYYFQALVDGINNAFRRAHDFVVNILNTLHARFSQFTSATTTAFTALRGAFTVIWQHIATVVRVSIDAVLAIVRRDLSLVSNAWNGFVSALRLIMAIARGIIEAAWGAISNHISSAMNTIQSVLRIAWGVVSNLVQTAINNLKNLLVTAWVNIVNSVQQFLGSPIGQFFINLGQQMFNSGKNMIQQLINGIKGMFTNVTNTVSDLGKSIWKILGFHSPPAEGPLHDSDQWMDRFGQLLIAGLNRQRSKLANAATALATAVTGGSNPAVNPSGVALAGAGGLPSGVLPNPQRVGLGGTQSLASPTSGIGGPSGPQELTIHNDVTLKGDVASLFQLLSPSAQRQLGKELGDAIQRSLELQARGGYGPNGGH